MRASQRAERSKERAKEILITDQGFSFCDEVVVGSEFFSAIAESCFVLDRPQFIRADRYTGVGVPRVLGPAGSPAQRSRRITNARLY
jgi:hypothetical protein